MEGRQEKKKMGIKIVAGAGGGLAGIILLGGAFATAALVSTFVIKRKQHSNSNSTHNQKTNQIDLLNKSKLEDDHELGSEGLSFLVSDSSSPLNHHPSNGTADAQNELGSTQILILDETTSKIEINGGKDKEILLYDFPKKSGNNAFCDESCISKEEFSFPAFDSSSGKVNKKNEPLEEVEARKVDEEVKVAHSNRVIVDDNCEIPSNIEEKDEVCDGNWEIIVGKIEELVEAAQANQLGVDESLHKPGEECDDDDDGEMITVEKHEELVEAIHAENGIQLSQEQEATMDGDEEIICLHSSITDRNEAETYDVNKAEILLSVIDSPSLSKPGSDDSAEVPLIIETMQLMKRDETTEAVQGDQITVEDGPQAQLIEPEEKEEESYEVDREITNGKCEEADQIAVEDDDQQMQLSEYQESPINGDQEKFISDKFSPESNSFLVYGVKVQEFSLPPPDGPLLSESGNLNEEYSAEAALHVEVVKPMEENETAEEVIYYQIVVENKPSTQFSEKGQIENCNDCSENVVAKGEEAVETVHEDIVEVFNNPKTQVSEEEDEDDDDNHIDSKNVEEAVETVHVNIVEVDKNPQTQLSEAVEEDGDDNNGGNENGKETVETVHRDILEVEKTLQTSSSEEDDEEESDDEEDDVGKVEESSETTGDSSLESNAEAIWPAESVQELSLKLKELQDNEQNLEETNEEDMEVNTENGYVQSNGHNIKEEEEEEGEGKFVRASTQKFRTETAALKQPINLFNLKFWIFSLLVPLLLLLLMLFWLHFAEIDFLQVSS